MPYELHTVEEFSAVNITTNKSQQETELRTFFEFVQEKMKNYTRETINSIQHEIFQIIMRADQGFL